MRPNWGWKGIWKDSPNSVFFQSCFDTQAKTLKIYICDYSLAWFCYINLIVEIVSVRTASDKFTFFFFFWELSLEVHYHFSEAVRYHFNF